MATFNDDESSSEDRARGHRAEDVTEWYFRLNGFFLIPGFIVHPDAPRSTPRTEADLLGIRLKHSSEGLWRPRRGVQFRANAPTVMTDDSLLTAPSKVGTVPKHLVAMVEVKAGPCSINGPWSDRGPDSGTVSQTNMARALTRVGFGNRSEVAIAAAGMFESLRHESTEFVVQYFSVGKDTSPDLANRYPLLKQITFDQIATFLKVRFSGFPEKIPQDRSISLWPGFGDAFRWWFESARHNQAPTDRQCLAFVQGYIANGRTG